MNPSAAHLIAVDWGTTSLRAALVAPDGATLERRSGIDGVMAMAGRSYAEILAAFVGPWRERQPDAPILMAGMVGSRQGWIEAPYVACPTGLDEVAAGIIEVEAGPLGRVGIVPGLVCDEAGAPEVIRGEETQVLGALAESGRRDGVFVLPGTHSKWVVVEGGRIARFHTFMTGEVYGLLRRGSILSRLMPDLDPDEPPGEAFDRGCRASLDAPDGAILNRLFSTRTLGLFDRLASRDAPGYLSGLLIGEELREALRLCAVAAQGGTPCLIARADLASSYERGLGHLGIATRRIEDAAFIGLHAIARHAGWLS